MCPAAALAWALAVGRLAYPTGVARTCRRGSWPAYRTAAWCAGVVAAAAHGVLAKHLYATGWGAGAQVMHYGGDVIGVALTALLCREWLAPARRPKLALSTAHQG